MLDFKKNYSEYLSLNMKHLDFYKDDNIHKSDAQNVNERTKSADPL